MNAPDPRLVATLGISPPELEDPPTSEEKRSPLLLRAGRHGLRRAMLRWDVADYVWLELDLSARDRPRPELAGGCALRAGGPADVEEMSELRHEHVTTMTADLVERRMRAGNALWLAISHDERVASSCWVFPDALPVHGPHLRLPPSSVAIEDVVSAPWARGRGIAPATWSLLGTLYAERGARTVLAKVDATNVPSRRAFAKAGFREVARMRIVWRGWQMSTRVDLPAGDTSHAWLGQLAGDRLRFAN
jgi:RimJ/RimL family protein N-acetyltransferase